MSSESRPTKTSPKLSSRLTLWYAGTFVLFAILACLLSYFAMGAMLAQELEEELEEDVLEFVSIFESQGISGVIREIDLEMVSGASATEFLKVLDVDGDEVYASDMQHWSGLEIDRALATSVVNSNTIKRSSIELEQQDYPIKVAYGRLSPDYVMVIGESMEESYDLLELSLSISAIMLLLVFPIAVYVGWSISRKAVLGIKEVSDAALAIHSGDFDRQIDAEVYGEELQTLVLTFNAMATRIRQLIAEMREMTDNIAHDLRSPITRLRVIAEGVISQPQQTDSAISAAGETMVECDRLIHLINTTLDVAEAEADVIPKDGTPIDISTLAAEMCELYQPLAEQKKIALSCAIEQGHKMVGRRQNLQRVFVNLIDNALKYTQPGGSVTVSLHADRGKLVIAVADSGVGISAQDQSLVFDRFYRCDESRSEEGCGLGLSFVAAVVKAHRGTIELESELAVGSTFTLRFDGALP